VNNDCVGVVVVGSLFSCVVVVAADVACLVVGSTDAANKVIIQSFYPRDAMLARVFAIATCLSVRPSVRPPHAGIVPSRAKAGS